MEMPQSIEIQQRLAMLYRKLFEENFDQDVFNSNKDILDAEISMVMCASYLSHCLHPYKKRFDMIKETDIVTKETFIDTVAHCIEAGSCPHEPEGDRKCVYGCRLVHFAAMDDRLLPAMKYLYENGCDMEVVSQYDNYTPLAVAAYCNQIETVRYLLSLKVDPSRGYNTPLFNAVRYEYEEIFDLLLKAENVDLNMKDAYGYSLLSISVRSHPEFIEPLLVAGAFPDIVAPNGTTPLMNAVTTRDLESVKLFIKFGANVNHRNRRGEVALLVSVFREDTEFCRTLLDAGADPNFQTGNDDNSLILLSSYDGCLEIVQLLMKYGGNPGVPNKLGYTPLHIAAWNGHLGCVKEFLAAGIPHDTQTDDKNTPLALAAHGGHLPVIEVLLPLKCNVNNSDKDADTALHYAAYNGLTKACELLLSYGADPDLCNKVNSTALWNAVYMSQKEVVKLLLLTNVKLEVLSRGIDQHAHSDDVVYVFQEPKSPLWVSVANNSPEIALLLISAGYDLHKEQWLIDGNFPDDSDERLRTVLTGYVQNPPRLVTRCRNFLRSYMGREVMAKVPCLPIPVTLKSYLTLSDLK